MKKVKITSNEFLSLYTGYKFCSLEEITKAIQNIFGVSLYSVKVSNCIDLFRNYIDKNRPALKQTLETTRILKKLNPETFQQQKEKFSDLFKKTIKTDTIMLDHIEFVAEPITISVGKIHFQQPIDKTK